jgi:hypothetical protein
MSNLLNSRSSNNFFKGLCIWLSKHVCYKSSHVESCYTVAQNLSSAETYFASLEMYTVGQSWDQVHPGVGTFVHWLIEARYDSTIISKAAAICDLTTTDWASILRKYRKNCPFGTSDAPVSVGIHTPRDARNKIIFIRVQLRHETTNELILCATWKTPAKLTRVEFHGLSLQRHRDSVCFCDCRKYFTGAMFCLLEAEGGGGGGMGPLFVISARFLERLRDSGIKTKPTAYRINFHFTTSVPADVVSMFIDTTIIYHTSVTRN